MGKFGGFMGGGNNNMQALMRQAQKMQEEAMRASQEVDEAEVEGQASGGLVKVTLKGNKTPVAVSIDPPVVDQTMLKCLKTLFLLRSTMHQAKQML